MISILILTLNVVHAEGQVGESSDTDCAAIAQEVSADSGSGSASADGTSGAGGSGR